MLFTKEIDKIITENFSHDEYNNLLITTESDNGKVSVLAKTFSSFMNSIVMRARPGKIEKSIFASHGDISKVESIQITNDVVASLMKSKEKDVAEYAKSLNRLYKFIESRKSVFMKNKDGITGASNDVTVNYVGLIYLTSVRTYIAATSHLVSYATGSVKTPGEILQWSVKSLLRDFENGNFDKSVKAIQSSDVKNATTESLTGVALVMAGLVAAVAFVGMLRVAVFYFFYFRVQLSEFFEQQASFLKIHEAEVRSSGKSKEEQDKIIAYQKKWADILMSLSDKISVDDNLASRKAKSDVIKSNKEISAEKINTQNNGMDFF